MSGWPSIAVVDCGGPYTLQLLRRLRELGIVAALYPPSLAAAALPGHVQGLIVAGSGLSVHDSGAPALDPALFRLPLPMLAIGYGLQAMNRHLGGAVSRDLHRQYRLATVEKVRESVLLQELAHDETVWMSTGDELTELAPSLKVVARTREGRVAVVEDRAAWRYGVQFHPEVASTACGRQLLSNFAETICGASRQWVLRDVLQQAVSEVRRIVGPRHVAVLVSGGLTSSVTAALLARALPAEQIRAVHVDTGLLRQGEADHVVAAMQALGLHRVEVCDARAEALQAVRTAATSPDRERQLEALLTQAVTAIASREGGEGTVLVVRGAAPLQAPLETGDPLAVMTLEGDRMTMLPCLLRDEWRHVARLLGLPSELIDRAPLGLAGVAVAIGGEVTAHRVSLLRAVDEQVRAELTRRHLADLACRLTCRLDPDAEARGLYQLTLRLPHSPDGMTLGPAALPWDALEALSQRLSRSQPELARVALDVTFRPLGREALG